MNSKYLWGLDISLKNTGVAIYDLVEKKFVYIDSFSTEKIYATKENKGLELNAVKLKKLADWLKPLIIKYPPSLASIERMFSRFKMETQVIAKATGVVQCMLWKVPQTLYAPKAVKLEIIHGSAKKDVVRDEILKRYPDLVMNNEDESDAVAVCLTYLIKHGLVEWIKENVPVKKKTRKKKVEKID